MTLTIHARYYFCGDMRVVFLFFLSLCFLLLRGDHEAYGATHHNMVTNTQYVKFANTDQGRTIVKNTSLSEEEEFFFNVESEDEDPVFGRRYYVLLTTLSGALVLDCFYGSFKGSLPFCRHLTNACSYIYILQRVLRI